MSQRTRLTATLLALAVLGAGALFVTRSDADATPAPEPLLRIQTLAVEAASAYEVERSFVGRVEAARESELGFELAGLLEKIWVEEGDSVERGHRVAALDTERLRSRRDELAAAREQALAQLELARSTDARVAEAAELNAVSTQEWDEARQGLQARAAAVKQLEAQIRSLEVEIEKSTLRAPFAGIVSARRVDEGEVLAAGRPVVRLLEAKRLEARVGIAADEANGLAAGDELEAEVRGRSFIGRIKAILPERETSTRAVTVLLELPDAASFARSGDLAEITLIRQVTAPGFWLPTSALTQGVTPAPLRGDVRGLWSCYVAEPRDGVDGKHWTSRRHVEVLHATTDRVYVRGTLRSGEQVITGGVHRVVPGQPVLLTSTTSTAPGTPARGAAS